MRIVVAALVAGLMAGPALADLKTGLEAYAAKDYPAAVQNFEAAGAAGDVWGWFYLGNMYVDGVGVGEDLARAAGYYRRAAEAGHTGAQLRLGNMYRRGLGVARDQQQAFAWLGRAVEGGNAEAAMYIGDMLATGENGEIQANDKDALNYYDIAANEGLPHAMAKLGLMIRDGRGRPADRIEAMKWLTLAAQYTEGEVKDEIERQRGLLRNEMSAGELTEADRRAAAWQPWSN